MIRKILALLVLFVLMLHPAIRFYRIWKDISVAESILSLDEKENFSNSIITRVVDNKQLNFAFNPKTSYFLYKGEGEVIRIGYYWKNLSILEKNYIFPFVGSNFNKIQQMLYVEDTPLHKDALDRLDKLKKFPLSLLDKIFFMFDTYSIDDYI